jgi:hypothetical protein
VEVNEDRGSQHRRLSDVELAGIALSTHGKRKKKVVFF